MPRSLRDWQKRAHFSQEVEWVGEMIQEDATRCLELDGKIKRLEAKIAEVAKGLQDHQDFTIDSGVWCRVYFRIGRRDRHHRAVCLRGKSFFVSWHVHVGQQLGKIPGDQDAEARQHSRQSSDDDRFGSTSKVCAGVAKIL